MTTTLHPQAIAAAYNALRSASVAPQLGATVIPNGELFTVAYPFLVPFTVTREQVMAQIESLRANLHTA